MLLGTTGDYDVVGLSKSARTEEEAIVEALDHVRAVIVQFISDDLH